MRIVRMAREPEDVRPAHEKAILVSLLPKKADRLDESVVDELRSLAKTAGAETVGELVQRRDGVNPAFYIGAGKVRALKDLAAETDADLIIFNGDLTPAQLRNIERETGVRAIDRTELILDIFARHARSRQAKLQVELAQLEYELPRLRRRWTHLERIKGGIGLRGPGEKQLEEDRRVIRKRITDLKREIARIDRHRRRLVGARDMFQICMVGYTNAGKSTLLNRLTGDSQHVSSKLFATLDTRTRLWRLSDGKEVVLSDTVGFIRHIPHHLVASFHATLEEVLHADLLLHVVDASDPAAEVMVQTVEGVLEDLGAHRTRRLVVLNKVDLIGDPLEFSILSRQLGRCVAASARTGSGLDALDARVAAIVEENWTTVRLDVSAADGGVRNQIRKAGRVLLEELEDERYTVVARLPEAVVRRLIGKGVALRRVEVEGKAVRGFSKEEEES